MSERTGPVIRWDELPKSDGPEDVDRQDFLDTGLFVEVKPHEFEDHLQRIMDSVDYRDGMKVQP